MNLFALDVNSGVEVSPGIKNLESIKSLLKIYKTEIPSFRRRND
jgi:phosphoribosylanthranilate isomerase